MTSYYSLIIHVYLKHEGNPDRYNDHSEVISQMVVQHKQREITPNHGACRKVAGAD